jgi:vacuolar-type H+-ATPase subunit F/Vma7
MRSERAGRLIIVPPPELEGGFLLAGVEVKRSTDPQSVADFLDQLVNERMEGVVAVHEPYLDALPADRKRRLDHSLTPVVVALPAGVECENEADRRARLLDRLQRAIGFQVTFGGRQS